MDLTNYPNDTGGLYDNPPDYLEHPPSPSPAPSPAAPGYSISGNPSAALINALYPGYSNDNGQFKYGGTGTGSISNPALAAQYLNSLSGPLASGNYQGFWNALGITTGRAAPDVLGTYAPILSAAGFNVNRNASNAISGKLTLPNGRVIDVGKAFGSNDPNQMGWQWLDTANAGGAPSPSAAALSANLGSFTAPWNEPFTEPNWTGGAYTPPAIPDYPGFDAPAPFTSPDYGEVTKDPGFKLREQEGADVLENSAAMQGRSLEGGYLKDLLKYGQMFGSTEYGNFYNRKASEYDRNYSDLLGAYTTNRDTTLGRYGLQKSSYDSLWNAKQAAKDTAYKQYLDREAAFRQNEDAAFDKTYRTASLGYQAST